MGTMALHARPDRVVRRTHPLRAIGAARRCDGMHRSDGFRARTRATTDARARTRRRVARAHRSAARVVRRVLAIGWRHRRRGAARHSAGRIHPRTEVAGGARRCHARRTGRRCAGEPAGVRHAPGRLRSREPAGRADRGPGDALRPAGRIARRGLRWADRLRRSDSERTRHAVGRDGCSTRFEVGAAGAICRDRMGSVGVGDRSQIRFRPPPTSVRR